MPRSRRCSSEARYASRNPVEVRRLEDQPLDHRLEPQDLLDPARDDGPQLVERVGGVGAIARVDEPGLEVGALDDLSGERLDARARRAAWTASGVGSQSSSWASSRIVHW